MKNDKEHLKIDLDFLDKKETSHVATPKTPPPSSTASHTPPPVKPTTTPVTTGYKYNWKNILIIGGIILFFGWAIFSDSGSSTDSSYTPTTQTSGYSNSDDDTVNVGEYSCSRYHYNQAVALDPDETEQQIESSSSAFEYRTNRLENLKDEIDNSYVNDYSAQWEIDEYNEMIDEYNSLLPAYKRDLAALDARIDRYNAQIQTHNNYLIANCTKRY
jgi:hypothetical protein